LVRYDSIRRIFYSCKIPNEKVYGFFYHFPSPSFKILTVSRLPATPCPPEGSFGICDRKIHLPPLRFSNVAGEPTFLESTTSYFNEAAKLMPDVNPDILEIIKYVSLIGIFKD
jgi:hypothetical protein